MRNNVKDNSMEHLMVNTLVFGTGIMLARLDESGVVQTRVIPPDEYQALAEQLQQAMPDSFVKELP